MISGYNYRIRDESHNNELHGPGTSPAIAPLFHWGFSRIDSLCIT
jgi:hypothetical protein